MTLTFDEFRNIKDSLPTGSMQQIADKLGVTADTVRNYFGGDHYGEGKSVDVHFEKGSNGGFVRLENTDIYNAALNILKQPSAQLN